MKRQADAVIGDAVLREIIGADFFGAVAGFDLAAAFDGESGLALILLLLVEAGAKAAHGFGASLDLRFFVLLVKEEAPWRVGISYSAIGGIDGLSGVAGRGIG